MCREASCVISGYLMIDGAIYEEVINERIIGLLKRRTEHKKTATAI